MRVYEAIVRGLEELGIDHAFGGAGESNTGLMIALKDSKRIRGVITRNEQAAAFMACGYAMFTDHLGLCFATAGPGAFNLISGMSMALTDSYPVLAITGYGSLEFDGKGQLNETSGIGRTPDSDAMFRATCKGSFLLKDPADTYNLLERAINLAFEGRPGPVHLAVSEDVADPKVSVGDYRPLRIEVAPVTPDPAPVAAAAATITGALSTDARIVVLAGFGAIRAKAGNEVRDLAERYRIPVITTIDGKGIIPEEHPLAVGVFGDTGHTNAWDAFLDADVVLAVGNSFAQHATFDFRESLLDGKTLIHVNIDPGEIDKVYPADHGIVADARLALTALSEALAALDPPPSRHTYKTKDYDTRRIYRWSRGLHPGRLAQKLSTRLPPRAVVVGDAGTHVVWLGYYLELREGQNFRKPGTYGPMAGHTNGAIGIKAADPDRPVISVSGDGCYNMSGFELMTAVEYDLPVIWIIFDDEQFKLIKLYQLAGYLEYGLVDFTNPDYVAYAKACGADGYRVETLYQFTQALDAALASGRPTLIDASISRDALPHFSRSPEGLAARIVERIRGFLARFAPQGVFGGVTSRVGRSRMPGVFARFWARIKRRFTR